MDRLPPPPAPVRKNAEPVAHFSHETTDPSGVPCIQVTRHRNYNVGSAIRHLWCVGLREGTNLSTIEQMRNLKDAKFYIDDELERLQLLKAREEANRV